MFVFNHILYHTILYCKYTHTHLQYKFYAIRTIPLCIGKTQKYTHSTYHISPNIKIIKLLSDSMSWSVDFSHQQYLQVFPDLNILTLRLCKTLAFWPPPKGNLIIFQLSRVNFASRLSNGVKFLYFWRTQAGKFLGYVIFQVQPSIKRTSAKHQCSQWWNWRWKRFGQAVSPSSLQCFEDHPRTCK